MMRIKEIDHNPFHSIDFEEVATGHKRVTTTLPLTRAVCEDLPDGVEVIVTAADLQGRELITGRDCPPRLLGEVLADELAVLSELGELPRLDKIGVILAGDLFARPELDRRGGSGDVRQVWNAFACRFRWVVGVAGNHDVFGPGWSIPHFEAFMKTPGVYFLDGDVVFVDGLTIAGVSGVVGNPRRPFRRSEEDLLAAVAGYLEHRPDVMVMHEGPDGASQDLPGVAAIREAIESRPRTLVVRGHAHWPQPLVILESDTQILNVDARVVILQR